MNNNKPNLNTLADLLSACERDPAAQRFLELAHVFLDEGWDIFELKGDRFEATKPADVDGIQSYGVFVDVDPDDGLVSWTATRYLDDDQYEYYDSSAVGRDVLTAITDETGFPYEDDPTFWYTLHVDD